jgi:hypothetical protein
MEMLPEVRTAMVHLRSGSHKRAVMFPESARVVAAEFNPFRAVNPVCIVYVPAIVNMREVELVHGIYDGDQIFA